MKKKYYIKLMIFFKSIKYAFTKYFDFSTRSTRSEYNYWFLFTLLASLILSLLDVFFSSFLSYLFSILIFIPSISISIRRLHDVNKSGWWIFFPASVVVIFTFAFLTVLLIDNILLGLMIILLSFIPLFIFIYWTSLKAGDQDNNRYGPKPII